MSSKKSDNVIANLNDTKISMSKTKTVKLENITRNEKREKNKNLMTQKLSSSTSKHKSKLKKRKVDDDDASTFINKQTAKRIKKFVENQATEAETQIQDDEKETSKKNDHL